MNVGEMRTSCLWPGPSKISLAVKLLGVSSGAPIKILKSLNFKSIIPIYVDKDKEQILYLDVEDMDPAVTLLECWSTKTCKPIVFPIFAKWMFSLSDFCCLSLISFENSLKIFLWLNEQHIPMSVGTGLNMSMQSISLPYKRHFFRSHSVSFIL